MIDDRQKQWHDLQYYSDFYEGEPFHRLSSCSTVFPYGMPGEAKLGVLTARDGRVVRSFRTSYLLANSSWAAHELTHWRVISVISDE